MKKDSGLLSKKKIISDISYSALQTLIVQTSGLLIFYISSRYLNKKDFGEFNWTSALGATLIAIGSLGLDNLLVKKVAASKGAFNAKIHLLHTCFVALFILFLYLILKFVFNYTDAHPLLLMVFLHLSISNVANSFKLYLTGMEQFKKLAISAAITNLLRVLLIILLFLTQRFNVFTLLYVYLASAFAEFLIGFLQSKNSYKVFSSAVFNYEHYGSFVREGLPLFGIVLFDSALARIDWLMLGWFKPESDTADYSFAYKVFEYSKLPLLIVAPILLTLLSRLYKNPQKITSLQKDQIYSFLKFELFAIGLLPLILCCTWTPLIDYFTHNKYGAVNELNYFLLAICVPIAGIVNFMWTLAFVQNQLKTILWVTIASSLFNISINAILIPFYSGLGAAIAYILSCTLQAILYIIFIKQPAVKIPVGSIFAALSIFVSSITIAKYLCTNILLTCTIGLTLYIVLFLLTRLFNPRTLNQLFS